MEVTTDAHVSGDGGGLALHTTMSLLTAARTCLAGPEAVHPPSPEDFGRLTSLFQTCAREFYDVRAGGETLRPDAASVALTVEGDVESWARFPRPARSPLILDAVGLRQLPPRAGVVLTVTGARTFLGQTVLRPGDSRFEVPITAEAEALGTPAAPSFGRSLRMGVRYVLGACGLLLLLVLLSRRLARPPGER